MQIGSPTHLCSCIHSDSHTQKCLAGLHNLHCCILDFLLSTRLCLQKKYITLHAPLTVWDLAGNCSSTYIFITMAREPVAGYSQVHLQNQRPVRDVWEDDQQSLTSHRELSNCTSREVFLCSPSNWELLVARISYMLELPIEYGWEELLEMVDSTE